MLRILLPFLSLVLILNSCSRGGKIIQNGSSNYKIFVSGDAIASEKHAAKELQTYLFQISNCTLEIVHQPEVEKNMIYVGFKDVPASVLKDIHPDDFANEEYIIRSDKGNLLIAGGGTRGTLYGVMGYLSDHLGCRWFTREVSKIPFLPEIRLPEKEDRQKPALEYRHFNWRESLDTQWVVHNRLNGMQVGSELGGNYFTFPFVHTFYQLVSPEKYFSTHPQYFSEVNGKRIGKDGQLCLTNPEVVKIATATVFDWIKAQPEASVYSVDQNDGEGYCECKNCRALDEKEGSHAGTLLHFVNQIADSVAKVYPKVKLQTLAYAYTVDPPKHIRPANNLMIRLCHYEYCSSHPIEGCEVNKPFFNQLNVWKQLAPGRLTIWDYFTDFRNYLMPFPNFESFGHDIKYYANNGVKGVFGEGGAEGGSEFAALRSWIIGQLMWDPNKDVWKLTDEFVTHVYGKSAPHITAYIKLLHNQITPDIHLSMWAEPFETNYINPATIQSADSLFNLARMAADKDTALSSRVELAYLPILWTKLNYFSRGGTLYLKHNEAPAVLSQFESFVERYHITALGADRKTYGSVQGFIDNIKIAATSGFYTQWWVLGPFDDSDHKGLYKVFPPEQTKFDSTRLYTGVNGKEIRWAKHNDLSSAYIDFNQIFGPSENVFAYAYSVIHMEHPERVKIGVGNNDGIRIWVNGKPAFAEPKAAIGPNRNTFTAALNKGDNEILVKVDQLRHGWGFYLANMEK